MNTPGLKRLLAGLAIILLPPAALSAGNPADGHDALAHRFALGVAGGLERFDTNLTVTERDTGNSVLVDGEGSFGLPETQTIPIIYGAARINEKHSVGFYTFRVRREGTALSLDRNFGDLNVNGTVTFSDRTSFSYLSYRYALFDDRQTIIQGLVGVYGVDLKFDFAARGEIAIGDEVVASGFYQETIDQFVPLPLIGLDYWSRVTERWYLGGKVSFVYGAYSDVAALVVDAALRARYRMTEHVSLVTGVNFLSADVEIKRTDTIRDISYGYEGLYLGLDFSF